MNLIRQYFHNRRTRARAICSFRRLDHQVNDEIRWLVMNAPRLILARYPETKYYSELLKKTRARQRALHRMNRIKNGFRPFEPMGRD